MQSAHICYGINVLLQFKLSRFSLCNRLESLKQEILQADQKAEERRKKKQEMRQTLPTKPIRLSKYKYPFGMHYREGGAKDLWTNSKNEPLSKIYLNVGDLRSMHFDDPTL